MSKTINIYTASVMGNDGSVLRKDEIRASSKKEAAERLHCDVNDVEVVKAHVSREFNEIYIDRIAGRTISEARLKTIRVFTPRRSYFAPKQRSA